MPVFDASAEIAAPPEEIWKLLYDPARFPEWWAGIGSVEPREPGDDGGNMTIYPDGYPDFPMPQQLETRRDERSVRISCLVSDLRFDWRLEESAAGTRVTVDVEIPEREAHRLATQQQVIAASLENLAALATAAV